MTDGRAAMLVSRSMCLVVLSSSFLFLSPRADAQGTFLRGDSNADGAVDLSDAVFTLAFLFSGGSAPACREASDANDDGATDLSDPIYTLSFLFLGGPA